MYKAKYCLLGNILLELEVSGKNQPGTWTLDENFINESLKLVDFIKEFERLKLKLLDFVKYLYGEFWPGTWEFSLNYPEWQLVLCMTRCHIYKKCIELDFANDHSILLAI